MWIDRFPLRRLEQRKKVFAQGSPAPHELKVAAARMVVWSVEARLRKTSLEPAKEGLMTGVQAQHDVRLPAVPAKMPLADQDTEDEPGIKSLAFHKNPYGETLSGPLFHRDDYRETLVAVEWMS